MNFTVTKEKDLIIVTVGLPALHRDRETRMETNRTLLRSKNVEDYLRKSNISVGECIQKDEIDNMGDRLTAVWKFNKPAAKTLDKTPPTVVQSNSEVTSIPEEETKAAGPAAKRRRRKTTTKKEG